MSKTVLAKNFSLQSKNHNVVSTPPGSCDNLSTKIKNLSDENKVIHKKPSPDSNCHHLVYLIYLSLVGQTVVFYQYK